MSTWTWTFIKPDHLSKKQIKNLLEYAIKNTGGIYYDNYKKHGWDYELKDWLDQHHENYDYFVNECGVPEEKMTDEFLTNELTTFSINCDSIFKLFFSSSSKLFKEFLSINFLLLLVGINK